MAVKNQTGFEHEADDEATSPGARARPAIFTATFLWASIAGFAQPTDRPAYVVTERRERGLAS